MPCLSVCCVAQVLIPLFVDQLSWSATIVVWDELLCAEGGPAVATVHALLAILRIGSTTGIFEAGSLPPMSSATKLMQEQRPL